jgi:potassium-dependent mechanosensitive channel
MGDVQRVSGRRFKSRARNHLQANRSLGFCFEILDLKSVLERRRTAGSRPPAAVPTLFGVSLSQHCPSRRLDASGLGFMRLARHLGANALASSYLALVLYAGVQVCAVLVASVLCSRPLYEVFMVQRNREMLQRRVRAAFGWLAVGTWVYVTLDGLGVMAPLWSAGVAALDTRYVRGAVSVSVGDVLAFALTVGAAFVVSSVLRFVLEKDVYPRVGLPRGLPYALSSLTHYVVVFLGLMLGLAALGLDLTHITILAGAFGVGIGIGLQNVVANFVSGLILLLERRIHVGDAIETADLGGEVREISFRSTTIRTDDGADVIVPNGKLTGERVTNWTLHDRLRRVSVSVPVVYAADPARVLGILKDTAEAYPKTLAKPAPAALCTGFRDNAMNFELRVWIAGFEDSDLVRSDLAVALHTALAADGIEFALSVPRELT